MAKKAAKKAAPATPKPDRQKVKDDVIDVIEAEARRNHAKDSKIALLKAGDEGVKLEEDLNINGEQRKALSIDYNTVVKKHKGKKKVGQLEAGDAKTLGAAVDLVLSKI